MEASRLPCERYSARNSDESAASNCKRHASGCGSARTASAAPSPQAQLVAFELDEPDALELLEIHSLSLSLLLLSGCDSDGSFKAAFRKT